LCKTVFFLIYQMQYGCGLYNNNHRIILSTYMIILPSSKTFSRNCRSKNLQFEQCHIRTNDFRAADSVSRNLPRFGLVTSGRSLGLGKEASRFNVNVSTIPRCSTI
jgi:hypothetical protein